ncbi:OsmC family protein [Ekhidna sp.]
MEFTLNSESVARSDGSIIVKESIINFGTTDDTADTLPSPAELFLGSFSSCILKNVERFSKMLKFEYQKASIQVSAKRLEDPPRMGDITYKLSIYSTDKNLNTHLLKKNIKKFGTIYNTVKTSCKISGNILQV